MSGFQVPHTTYKLVFDDDAYAGIEIKVRGTTLDELFQLDEAQEAIAQVQGAKAIHEAIQHRNQMFVDKVDSWNLEDDGVPVPCTVEELGRFEAPFLSKVILAWRRAAAGVVPAPLDDGSTSGEPTLPDEVETALLAIPSESLAS